MAIVMFSLFPMLMLGQFSMGDTRDKMPTKYSSNSTSRSSSAVTGAHTSVPLIELAENVKSVDECAE